MPITICNLLAPKCFPDWNGIGAIATAAATGAALFIPFWLRGQDAREKQRALAYALLLKMIKIHSDEYKFFEHVEEQRALAEAHKSPPDVWGFFRPFASLPTNVTFTSDELSALFMLKDNETFNAVLSMDEVHASDIENFRIYADKRETLTQMLPGAEMTGAVGGIDLTKDQMLRVQPFSVQLDMLVADITASIERHASSSEAALRCLHRVLTDKLGMKVGLTLPSDKLKS